MDSIFKLKYFSPVGYVSPVYNNNLCICRYPLYHKCAECISNNSSLKCDVIKNDNMYLHIHCSSLYKK